MQEPQHHHHQQLREPFQFPSTSPQTHTSQPRQHPALTRHESFSYPHPPSISDNRPRAPPLRSAHSAYTPRAPGTGSQYSPNNEMSLNIADEKEGGKRGSGDGDMDELTTKGRKRKRLAKACSACHKNKRRCDGFAPCSNCEFSSRPCLYLNALGETIPPPRTRESFSASGKGSQPMSKSGSGQSQGVGDGHRMEDERYDREDQRVPGPRGRYEAAERRKTVHEVVDSDPVLSSELIDIFFRVSSPFSSMLHPPTFHHRLYLAQTSPVLLDAIYAFAARSSPSLALAACYPPTHPAWLRGEGFAERAHAEAERIVAARERESGSKPGSWEEIEEIQAFTLLSIYFACLRQASLAAFYLDLAISMLRPTLSLPDQPECSADQATLAESSNRTFWLIALHDLCAAANGRARIMTDAEMEAMPLPGPEGWWVRHGGSHRGNRRDGLVPGSGDWVGEGGQVGELGHVLRILSIFSDIMAAANDGGSGDLHPVPLHQHQDALKSWAQNLPSHLRFDEHNLSTSISRLQSPLHHVAIAGWAFGYMHAIAECGMFYLQAAVAQQPGSSWTAQRQSQAVENIAVVLDAMGVRGRESPLMLFPIAVVSNWQDHIRSPTSAPTPQQRQLDERLSIWWAEAKHQWGIERAQATDRAGASALPPYTIPTKNGRSLSSHNGQSGGYGRQASYGSESRDQYDQQYPRSVPRAHVQEYDDTRKASIGQNPFRHLLDSTPIPSITQAQAAGGTALGLYSNGLLSGPRPTFPSTMDNGRTHSSPRSYQLINPYVRSEAPVRPSQPQIQHRPSPPDLADSVSTSASLLLPTPTSARPNLPPLPNNGNRPRAISSVIPYSVSRPPSPIASEQTINSGRRHLARLSLSDKDFISRGPSPTTNGGNYFPPSAELRHLRQLDEIPRQGSGRNSIVKGWREDPFSTTHLDSREKKRSWDDTNLKGDTANVEPFGIAALISAAESEREKEEKKRASEGSGSDRGNPDGVEGAENGEDVTMRDEDKEGQNQLAVVA